MPALWSWHAACPMVALSCCHVKIPRRMAAALRHRAQWLAAIHRRRGGGERRSAAIAGARSGGGDCRPANRYVQHRHRDLCLDRLRPKAEGAQGKDQLIDGSAFFRKMPVAWIKRREIAEQDRETLVCSAMANHRWPRC